MPMLHCEQGSFAVVTPPPHPHPWPDWPPSGEAVRTPSFSFDKSSTREDDDAKFGLELPTAVAPGSSPASVSASAGVGAAGLVVAVGDRPEGSRYAGGADGPGSKESTFSTTESSFTSKESAFSLAADPPLQHQEQQEINAGIYADSGDEDDGFGSSSTGGGGDASSDRPVSGGAAGGEDGGIDTVGGVRKRRRGGGTGAGNGSDSRGAAAATASASASPWGTSVDYWSGESEEEEEEEEDDDNDGENAGCRGICPPSPPPPPFCCSLVKS